MGTLGHQERLPVLADGRLDRAAIDAERRLYYGLAAYVDAQVGWLHFHE